MNRNAVYAIGALLLAGALAVMAWRAQHLLTSNLPPRIECRDEADAREKSGLSRIAVLGTGSMAPLIPAAAPGQDPYKTVVAYAVVEDAATYDDIQPGDLCIYFAEWANGFVMHQAALKDWLGWVMSGLNNARSEPHWRVTPANFRGIVKSVYVW